MCTELRIFCLSEYFTPASNSNNFAQVTTDVIISNQYPKLPREVLSPSFGYDLQRTSAGNIFFYYLVRRVLIIDLQF